MSSSQSQISGLAEWPRFDQIVTKRNKFKYGIFQDPHVKNVLKADLENLKRIQVFFFPFGLPQSGPKSDRVNRLASVVCWCLIVSSVTATGDKEITVVISYKHHKQPQLLTTGRENLPIKVGQIGPKRDKSGTF